MTECRICEVCQYYKKKKRILLFITSGNIAGYMTHGYINLVARTLYRPINYTTDFILKFIIAFLKHTNIIIQNSTLNQTLPNTNISANH